MAVEVLLNKKYGMAVDWWSFGILIYVMLVGKVSLTIALKYNYTHDHIFSIHITVKMKTRF